MRIVPRLLPAWADAALEHGASGLVFASWDDIKRDDTCTKP